jgi:manganese/iron transport system substrate-binding protein
MKQRLAWPWAALALLVILVTMVGCGSGGPAAQPDSATLSRVSLSGGEKLQVVATTNIVGDVTHSVGGDHIALTVLMPPGVDPHAFEPTPQDVAAVSKAHVVFANGAGLEAFLSRLLESADAAGRVVPLSQGIELWAPGAGQADAHEHDDEGGDPHTWIDPNNVIIWARNAASALSSLDPANADVYQANAQAYINELEALDAWIREQVAQIPENRRYLVTDHLMFAYLAQAYGLEQIGTIFPSYSTLSEPSAQEVARLEDAIREVGVPAVFVGKTVNPALAERVAADTGVQLVFLYTGSLSEPGGEAATYIDYMRYNVNAIVSALR